VRFAFDIHEDAVLVHDASDLVGLVGEIVAGCAAAVLDFVPSSFAGAFEMMTSNPTAPRQGLHHN
jgi:hypothetical protein